MVGVGDLTRQRLAIGVIQLPGPILHSQRCASVSCRKAKGSNPATCVISEELQVQQKTVSAGPAAQDLLPTTLLLVAMGKCDVDMLKGEVILRQLLEAENNGVLGRILDPRSLLDERSTNL